MDKGIEGSKDI
jgi:hypothetical protein